MTTELTKAAQQALEACPFCGSKKIKVHIYGDAVIGGEPDAFAQCHDCSVIGPNGKTEAEAAQAWNTRALTQRPAAQEVDDGDVTGQPGPLPETGWDEVPEGAFRKPSPTAGMNLGERIKHVGGRENAAGYIEFGSVMAVRALVRQYLRDLPAPQQATPLPFSVVADPSIAPGEAVVKLGGDEVGRIVNIDAQQATPDPVQPFLVRDVAALLGASVPDVCKALAHLGHGQRSTNMEIKPEEALAVAEHIRAAAAKPEPAGEVVAWCPALTYPGYERERAWTNGRPRQEDIAYWQATGVGITYAYDRTAPGVPDGWAVSAYKAAGLTIQSMAQLEGPDLWKIADATGNVLNKQGEWEWEPMPSSRDDAFLARCRYATLTEASAALAAAQAKGGAA